MTTTKKADTSPPANPGQLKKGETVEGLPALDTSTHLDPGEVYIKNGEGGRVFTAGQKLVLKRSGSDPLYVTTVAPKPNLTTVATWVSRADKKAFDAKGDASAERTARLFSARHRWARLISGPGLVLALTVLVGVIAAGAAAGNGLFPPPADVDAARAQAVLSWAAQPLTQLPSQPDPAAREAAATEVEQRSSQAHVCLQAMQGLLPAAAAQIPEISCAHIAPSWLRKNWAALVGGIAGLAVAVLAAAKAWMGSGFRKSL
jgi:hypothetical protein